jgi:hypothetical protein
MENLGARRVEKIAGWQEWEKKLAGGRRITILAAISIIQRRG